MKAVSRIQKENTVKVKFVFTPEYNEVTAIFIDITNGKTFDCYAHIGQHSLCSSEWIKEQEPATKTQYAPLLAELKTIGYNPVLTK